MAQNDFGWGNSRYQNRPRSTEIGDGGDSFQDRGPRRRPQRRPAGPMPTDTFTQHTPRPPRNIGRPGMMGGWGQGRPSSPGPPPNMGGPGMMMGGGTGRPPLESAATRPRYDLTGYPPSTPGSVSSTHGVWGPDMPQMLGRVPPSLQHLLGLSRQRVERQRRPAPEAPRNRPRSTEASGDQGDPSISAPNLGRPNLPYGPDPMFREEIDYRDGRPFGGGRPNMYGRGRPETDFGWGR